MTREPLAVVGIGCRLPGGLDSPEQLWEGLLAGVDAIRPVPADRWELARYYDPNADKAGKIKNARGGFIDGIDQFDAQFFGYFPAEASRMDPQQRLLLEVVHEAVEDAGIPLEKLAGSRTSVFVGSFVYDYMTMQTADAAVASINPYVAMGTGVCAIANRVSYAYDLKGPSISLDTACSSSLVAVHMAAHSVWNGEAELAIAAGVNLMIRPEASVVLSRAGFLSPDGACKSFDAAANGYVRSEGIGAVILKPLARALADGDEIYAVVRGSAVNQDGHVPEGFMVPSRAAQLALLDAAYRDAGVDPATIAYVEAHGPGTPTGDPIEAGALGAVLGHAPGRTAPCLVGSVKSNLGHLEGASGIAGFIKATLVARHRRVPANLHFKTPNPAIDFAGLQLQVVATATPLDAELVRIGVNSFGAGGTNAHVVLESPPVATTPPRATPPAAGLRPVLLSARSDEALAELAQRTLAFIKQTNPDFHDLSRSLLERRSRHARVVSIAATHTQQLVEGLQLVAMSEAGPSIGHGTGGGKPPRVAFMFSGQGGQWAGMGLALYEAEPVFRAALDEIEGLFQAIAGWSLLAALRADEGTSQIDRTRVVQPCVMAVQVALARLLLAEGVEPAAVVGHSIGEVAAAHIAGALTLEQAVAVIFHRSSVQDRASGLGRMLAVGITEAEALKLIAPVADRVSLATVNGPTNLTLSGDGPALVAIAAGLESRGKFQRFVRVDVPYHSHFMDPLRDELIARTEALTGSPATLPLYSSVSGQQEPGTHLDGAYWFRNVREPVLFTKALEAMAVAGCDCFIEVGPHPVLVSGALALLAQLRVEASAHGTMRRGEAAGYAFAHCLGALQARGWRGLAPGGRLLKLPHHPWRHERVWFELPASARHRQHPLLHPFLERGERLLANEDLGFWEAPIGLAQLPFLKDHQVDGEAVFPGTGHLELAQAVAQQAYPGVRCHIEDVRFDTALIFPDEKGLPPSVRLDITSNEGDYKICSRAPDAGPEVPWTQHSTGRINHLGDAFTPQPVDLAELKAKFGDQDAMDPAAFYATIEAAGLNYGPMFQGIQQLWHKGREMLSRLVLPEALSHEATQFGIHPALLDACLHTGFADVHRHMGPERVFLPARIARVRYTGPAPTRCWAFAKVLHRDEQYLEYDAWLLDDAGNVLAELQHLTCKLIAGARHADRLYAGTFAYRWEETPTRGDAWRPNHDLQRCIILAPDAAQAAPLVAPLAAQGLSTRVVSWAEFETPAALAALLATERLDRRTLLVLLAGAPEPMSSWSASQLAAPTRALLIMARAVIGHELFPRVAMVTRDATSAGEGAFELAQAPMWGLLRVMKNERPNVSLKAIDLSAEPTPAEWAELALELGGLHPDLEDFEVGLRGTRRLVRVLDPVRGEVAEADAKLDLPGCGGAYRAVVGEVGLLDSLGFRQQAPIAPGPTEVELAVHAAGLNFKDVVNAMGLLSERAVLGGLAGNQLGLEVSGRVLRCGRDVTHLAPGDEVVACVANGFAGRVIAEAGRAIPKPAHLSHAQGASLLAVFLTAHYGLNHLARIEPGETVLVHSAAGGVGIAAIQVAQLAGARVIATAGTKAKREYVASLGVEHIFDSRSLDFYSQVMAVTGGRGVDVVLNSLTGGAIAQGLKCLAPFGRFVELGKTDIYKNAKLNLERMGENLSFFVVDVDRLATQKPVLHQRMLREVVALFAEKKLVPHDLTTFPIGELGKALRFMSRSAYHGKIVVTMDDQTVAALPPLRATFDPAGTYLVTGGASGFGLQLALWLAARGARHLVLASRSGCKLAEDFAAVEALRAQGVTVELPQLDLTDAAAVHALVAGCPALKGVIHGAGLLADAQLQNLDEERFLRVFAPKALGAWHLHEATAALPLDFFLLLSSLSAVLGIVGQANYAAANYWLDSLAERRCRDGLVATSLGLGVLGEYAGMSRTAGDTADIMGLLASHGIRPMPLTEVLAKVETALGQRATQRMVATFDWSAFVAAHPHLTTDRRFLGAIAASQASQGTRAQGTLRAALVGLAPEAQLASIEEALQAALARILDIPPARIATTTPIERMGLDSLMLNQLRNWILRGLDVNYPLIKLLKGPSVQAIAAELLPSLVAAPEASADGPTATEGASQEFSLAGAPGIDFVSPGLVRGAGDRASGVRLFCFHPMGAGASIFSRFLAEPPPGLDVFALQTPGRENRHAEERFEQLPELVDAIVAELGPWLDRPFLVWGHSFGGIVAFEVLRKLEAQGHDALHLVLTGTTAPDLVRLWQNRDILQLGFVADHSADYLISTSRYVDDVEFIRSILPVMRKDKPLLMSYRYTPGEPLQCPITAYAALQDDMVYPDEIAGWAQQTVAPFELFEVEGDHWFLNRHHGLLRERLGAIAARSPLAAHG